MAWAKKANGTKHTCEQSQRAFGKRHPGCPRCEELAQGAAPREGWQKDYFEKKAQDARWLEEARKTHRERPQGGCEKLINGQWKVAYETCCVCFDW